jgi:hypothetical protein
MAGLYFRLLIGKGELKSGEVEAFGGTVCSIAGLSATPEDLRIYRLSLQTSQN